MQITYCISIKCSVLWFYNVIYLLNVMLFNMVIKGGIYMSKQDKPHVFGYCRISVDDNLDDTNTSIENQRGIITDFVSNKFPDAELHFLKIETNQAIHLNIDQVIRQCVSCFLPRHLRFS